MLKTNEGDIGIVRNYNFPPGVRFVPTDKEALKEYLLPRVNRDEKYPGFIETVDIYKYEPQDLPGFKLQEPSFYFTPRESLLANGSRIKRTVNRKSSWSLTNKSKLILDSKGVLLGTRNTLNYRLGNKDGTKTKTDYLMVEYVLHDSCCKSGAVNDVVLCKIYFKKQSKAEELRGKYEKVAKERPIGESLHRNKNQAQNEEQWNKQVDYPSSSKEYCTRTLNLASTLDNDTSTKGHIYDDQNQGSCLKRKSQEYMTPPGQAKKFEPQSSKRPIPTFNNRYINLNVAPAPENTGIEVTGFNSTSDINNEPGNQFLDPRQKPR